MARLLFFALLAYVFAVVATYLLQRHLQYYPDKSSPGTPAQNGLPGMEVIQTVTEDGLNLKGWFMPPRDRDGKVVVLFHGNAGHIGHRAVKARYLIEKGYGVYLCEYRGYGGNPGSASEEGLYRDARSVLKWLGEQGYGGGRLVYYGESIGSGVAVQMAVEAQPGILILEAPFSSAVDVARISYFWLPLDLLMKDKFDNFSKIRKVKSQLLIVHGDQDGIIPLSLAQKLFEGANHPKEFVTINGGGHNDLYDHRAGDVIVDWLAKKEEEAL